MSMRQPTFEAGEAVPPPEAIRTALDSILKSRVFSRSERHSKFLRFVCETALNGDGGKLNEYLIAQQVFERGADFSPGDDSVVRRQAYSLRQKLQDYYSIDGKDDTVRIELPVGRYVPTFGWSVPQKQEPVETPPALQVVARPPAAAPARTGGRVRWIIGTLILVAAGAALGWTIGRRAQFSTTHDPAIAELWEAWLTDQAGAVICFSNPRTAIVRRAPEPFPRNKFPHRIEVAPQEAEQLRQAFDLPQGGHIYLSPGLVHAKMGEALGSVALAAFFTRAQVPEHTTQSRFLSWEDFRNKNLILLGHDEANRWLDPILSHMPFHLAATEADKPRRIVNTNPAPGEPGEYHVGYSIGGVQPIEDYVLVSMLRGIDGRHRLLLINGVNAVGTDVAVDFLTDPASVRNLLEALHRAAPGHKGVWRFQAVLREEERDKIPTRADIVAVRVLQQD
jgi:hypothetical protein